MVVLVEDHRVDVAVVEYLEAGDTPAVVIHVHADRTPVVHQCGQVVGDRPADDRVVDLGGDGDVDLPTALRSDSTEAWQDAPFHCPPT